MKVEHDLPHYVRRKTAKGRTYYYFTMPSTDRARPGEWFDRHPAILAEIERLQLENGR